MWRSCFLFAISLAGAAATKVEVQSNEVWITQDGRARQLTSDGKAKLQALLSPSANRAAYYEQCPQNENCRTSIVVLDLKGKRLQSFPVKTEATGLGICASILNMYWPRENTIGAECHFNPSMSEYIETDLSTLRVGKNLLGYGFTPSPDGQHVAHVGPIVHFAAPVDQSNELQIDKRIVYPRSQAVSKGGSVHEFHPNFVWSADSRHVAFIDCVSRWTATGRAEDGQTPTGELTNKKCYLAVVALDGEFARFPVTTEAPGEISWHGLTRLSLKKAGVTAQCRIPIKAGRSKVRARK